MFFFYVRNKYLNARTHFDDTVTSILLMREPLPAAALSRLILSHGRKHMTSGKRESVSNIRRKSTSSGSAEPPHPTCDINEGAYREGEGTTPVTTACPEDRCGYTFNQLSWNVTMMPKIKCIK